MDAAPTQSSATGSSDSPEREATTAHPDKQKEKKNWVVSFAR